MLWASVQLIVLLLVVVNYATALDVPKYVHGTIGENLAGWLLPKDGPAVFCDEANFPVFVRRDPFKNNQALKSAFDIFDRAGSFIGFTCFSEDLWDTHDIPHQYALFPSYIQYTTCKRVRDYSPTEDIQKLGAVYISVCLSARKLESLRSRFSKDGDLARMLIAQYGFDESCFVAERNTTVVPLFIPIEATSGTYYYCIVGLPMTELDRARVLSDHTFQRAKAVFVFEAIEKK
jgi:hypothetical protein